jgi:hypothetical protein
MPVWLTALSTRAWQALSLVLAALLLWQSTGRLAARHEADQARATLAGERAAAADAARQASERYRDLERNHREDIDAIDHQARQALARATADAGAARAAAGRLQHDLASYIAARRRAAQAGAAAGQCAPDSDAIDLLAELQRRADERAGELAGIADEARTRGLACERAHASAHTLNEESRHAQTP